MPNTDALHGAFITARPRMTAATASPLSCGMDPRTTWQPQLDHSRASRQTCKPNHGTCQRPYGCHGGRVDGGESHCGRRHWLPRLSSHTLGSTHLCHGRFRHERTITASMCVTQTRLQSCTAAGSQGMWHARTARPLGHPSLCHQSIHAQSPPAHKHARHGHGSVQRTVAHSRTIHSVPRGLRMS